MLEDFLDLWLPVKCVLCSKPPSILCADCDLQISPGRQAVHRGKLQGWAVRDYDEVSAQLIESFKEQGVTSLAKYFAKPMAVAIFESVNHHDVLVVPPSRPEAHKRRGYLPAQMLAVALAKELKVLGRQVLVARRALRLTKSVADQSGLAVQQRFENLAGALCADSVLSGRNVILVDDIVTTGATLLECRRAVIQAGANFRFFSTFAETKSKMATKI